MVSLTSVHATSCPLSICSPLYLRSRLTAASTVEQCTVLSDLSKSVSMSSMMASNVPLPCDFASYAMAVRTCLSERRTFPTCMYPSDNFMYCLYSSLHCLSEIHGLHVLHVLALKGLIMFCALALIHMAKVWLRTSGRVPLVTGRKEEKLFIANNDRGIYSACFRV